MNRTQCEISPEIAVSSHSDTEESSSSSNSSASPDQMHIAELRGLFEGLVAGNVTVATVCEDELLTTISQELEKKKDLKQYPTAALGDDTNTENLHQSGANRRMGIKPVCTAAVASIFPSIWV